MEYKFRFLIDNEMHHLSLGELIYGFTPTGFLYPEKFAGVSTGLFDKNQNEIYTGDILKSPSKEAKLTVKYNVGSFIAQCMQSYVLPSNFYLHEVVGNIYQNPELLNAK